jgi:hypothetical protein
VNDPRGLREERIVLAPPPGPARRAVTGWTFRRSGDGSTWRLSDPLVSAMPGSGTCLNRTRHPGGVRRRRTWPFRRQGRSEPGPSPGPRSPEPLPGGRRCRTSALQPCAPGTPGPGRPRRSIGAQPPRPSAAERRTRHSSGPGPRLQHHATTTQKRGVGPEQSVPQPGPGEPVPPGPKEAVLASGFHDGSPVHLAGRFCLCCGFRV